MVEVAYVSTYVPRKCGLATYTHHLRESVRQVAGNASRDRVVALVHEDEDKATYDAKTWFIHRGQRDDYARLARRLNDSSVDVVSLQHEFGIFGGRAGEYILDFVHSLRKPLVTTFHTVFERPEEPYRSVQADLAMASDRIIVMNRRASSLLTRAFGIRADKILFIPHGSPVPVPGRREETRRRLGWSDRAVVMTFGLLSQGKGIELIIDALRIVVEQVPNVLYAIVGQTHPEVLRREGEAYRLQLRERIRALGLEDHVQMIDRYLTEAELVDCIAACDLYVTPYPGLQQITSGTLAYAVGLGRPVLSTPYSYATDLLGQHPDLLIPYGETAGWAAKIADILANPEVKRNWERRIAAIGRELHWPTVGRAHLRVFSEVADRTQRSEVGEGVNAVASVSR